MTDIEQECYLRPMVHDDLESVLCWRNHPDVRRYMYSQHEISFEEHKHWFESASVKTDRHLLIFERNNIPLGFININQIKSGGIAEWGFYTAPEAPKGTGFKLGVAVLQYAFVDLNLHKLCGEVLAYNKPSINFHLKLGFQQEGRLRDHYFDGQQYYNIEYFGLLARDWQVNI